MFWYPAWFKNFSTTKGNYYIVLGKYCGRPHRQDIELKATTQIAMRSIFAADFGPQLPESHTYSCMHDF
jgi:hypothetical protein